MSFKDHLCVDNSQIYITFMKHGSPMKSSIWISTKYLQYCTILDFSSKPVSPVDFSASVNDTSFFQAAEIKKSRSYLQFLFFPTLFPTTPVFGDMLISKHILKPCAIFHPPHHCLCPTPHHFPFI